MDGSSSLKSGFTMLFVWLICAPLTWHLLARFYAVDQSVFGFCWCSLGILLLLVLLFVRLFRFRPGLNSSPMLQVRGDTVDGARSVGRPLSLSRRKRARLRWQNVELSSYGRIPAARFVVLAQHVRDLGGPVLSYLPLNINREMRDFTLYKTLQTVLKDSLENDNEDSLSPEDIRDLGSFVEISAHIAIGESGGQISKIDEAVYNAVLSSLLDDWLYNWNAHGIDGPPKHEASR